MPDALGSVRQIADANPASLRGLRGNVTLAESYEPYGSVLTSTGTASSIFGYAGEQIDTYIKLLFLRARYYSPETARFLSKDVWQGDYTRPQSLNAWAYVEGEPINHTDPSGKWALELARPTVWAVREEGDTWRSLFKSLGVDRTTLSDDTWGLGPVPEKIDLSPFLDPLILQVAAYQERSGYLPLPHEAINCYPTALTCAAGSCQYLSYYSFDIDKLLQEVADPVATSYDLQLGDVFRLGTPDKNEPAHYGMILLQGRERTDSAIMTFNGFLAMVPELPTGTRFGNPPWQYTGYAIASLDEVKMRIGTGLRGIGADPTGYYRMKAGISADEIVRKIKQLQQK